MKMNTFSEDELLAAIQVQLIYIIMRLIHGVSQPGGLDLQIMVTFKVSHG